MKFIFPRKCVVKFHVNRLQNVRQKTCQYLVFSKKKKKKNTMLSATNFAWRCMGYRCTGGVEKVS